MQGCARTPARQPLALRRLRRAGVTAFASALLFVPPTLAGEPAPFGARAGLDIAAVSALAWAPDARLVYIENDEALDGQGAAARWGYLFFSPHLDKARAYSVRDGKIAVADTLDMKLETRPLASDWIDSGVALAAAERVGRSFCQQHGGRLSTMFLMRGPFQDGDPDETTWTFVYASANAPSLFVVVDAAQGKVRRTSRG